MVVFQGVSSQSDLVAHSTDVLAYAGQILARKGRALLTAGLLPLVGGLFNLVIFGYGLKTQGTTIASVAAAGLILCVVIAVVIRVRAGHTGFFASRGGRDEAEAEAAELPAAQG